MEHTFYVGAFEELITDSSNPSYKAIEKTRVDSSAMHIRRTNWSDVSTDAIEYLHRDHLGSIEVTSSSAGTAVDQRGYDPFGGRRATDWSRELTAAEKKAIADGSDEPAERGYTDHEMLDRTGLIHMNGRVYDPEIGRFLSPDPIVQSPGYSQSWNRYAYVMNSPMSYTDPSGYVRQPSSAGDICAASPVCLNMNDSNGGPSGGSTSYGVPSTRISVTIFEERRLGSSEDIFWPRVFGGGFGRGIPGGNDQFGLPGLIDRILRIEIDNVELINRRVETTRVETVSTTESSETDEAMDYDGSVSSTVLNPTNLAQIIPEFATDQPLEFLLFMRYASELELPSLTDETFYIQLARAWEDFTPWVTNKSIGEVGEILKGEWLSIYGPKSFAKKMGLRGIFRYFDNAALTQTYKAYSRARKVYKSMGMLDRVTEASSLTIHG
ncbi:MAG: RHS repeat-associated core domain-containing protein, partial [Cyanobacteria bacterium J06638_22]